MPNVFITNFLHTEELYLISYFFFREVDGSSVGRVGEQA